MSGGAQMFLMWLILKAASGPLIWHDKNGNCASFFWPALIFHHLPASVPALNEISCVGCRAPASPLADT